MKDLKKATLKRLKRKRKVANKNKQERKMVAAKRMIMFGNMGKAIIPKSEEEKKKAKEKKEKQKAKPLPPYRAVKLTAKLDQLSIQIRSMDPTDPRLEALKEKKVQIKKKLNQK